MWKTYTLKAEKHGWNELKTTQISEKYLSSWVGRINIIKMSILPKQSTDSMLFPIKMSKALFYKNF